MCVKGTLRPCKLWRILNAVDIRMNTRLLNRHRIISGSRNSSRWSNNLKRWTCFSRRRHSSFWMLWKKIAQRKREYFLCPSIGVKLLTKARIAEGNRKTYLYVEKVGREISFSSKQLSRRELPSVIFFPILVSAKRRLSIMRKKENNYLDGKAKIEFY